MYSNPDLLTVRITSCGSWFLRGSCKSWQKMRWWFCSYLICYVHTPDKSQRKLWFSVLNVCQAFLSQILYIICIRKKYAVQLNSVLKLFSVFLSYKYVCESVHSHVHVSSVPMEASRRCWMPWTGITGSCGLPHVDSGNPRLLLGKAVVLLIAEPSL